jgi:hypothetical protein
MAGGLLNIISYGTENVILNGNPKKTYFKAVFNKYTNFGMQKFRLDHDGQRILNFNTEVKMVFKVERYADLLSDLFLTINIPDIWSPLQLDNTGVFVETGFKWVEELGATLIKEVQYSIGGQIISKFSGEFLTCMKERDYSNTKKDLWNKLTGNLPDFYDPANGYGKELKVPPGYPSVVYNGTTIPEPSIKGRTLYVPIDGWFAHCTKTAIPLISLQYNILEVTITFRPIKELYTLRDLSGIDLAPNPVVSLEHIYRYIQPPQDISAVTYDIKKNNWNADIHLWGTYIFLDEAERLLFAKHEQQYLIRDIYEYEKFNTAGSQVVNFDTRNCVANLMTRFRRSDAYTRNQWNNYSNWPYNGVLPQQLTQIGLPVPHATNIWLTGAQTTNNVRGILQNLGILCDGKYREIVLPSGVYDYIEKLYRTPGDAKDGLYIYNFNLNTDRDLYQPCGAMNMTRFKDVGLEFNTIQPPLDQNAPFTIICDDEGNEIGIRKNSWVLNLYNFDMKIIEERYNILTFKAGNAGLMYAR